MKTSGISCETKFGLLGFLGHPNMDGPLLKRGKVGKSCVPVTSQLPGIEVFVAHRLLFSSRTICEKCTSALRQHRGSTSKVHFSPITTTFCSTMPDVGYFYRYFLKIFSATSNYISSSASHLIASQDERRLSSVLLRSCTKHYIFPNSLSDI